MRHERVLEIFSSRVIHHAMENLGVGEGDEFDTPLAPVSTPKVVGGYFD